MENVVEENRKYRLRFTSSNEPTIGFDIFTLPPGMKPEDAYQVISFLVESITNIYGYEPYTLENISLVNLYLFQDFAFKSVSDVEDDYDVIELFTISDRLNRMGYDRVSKNCFEWFTPNISEEAVKTIYSNLDISSQKHVLVKSKSYVA